MNNAHFVGNGWIDGTERRDGGGGTPKRKEEGK